MSIPSAPPLVIAKTRTRTIGDESITQQTLNVEIQKQGIADVQWMLRSIAAVDTADQIDLGNPPSAVTVDNKPARSFDDAQRKIVVLFGSVFASAAMRVVEHELRANIDRTTDARTGRLHGVTANWRWRLIVPGKGSQVVTSATTLPPFTRGTTLVLEPAGVPYATLVNMRVRGTGKLMTPRTARGTRKAKGKPARSLGFLGATVRALRGRNEFREFTVAVVFSKDHEVPGELSKKQGTGSIVIRLKSLTARFSPGRRR